MDDYNFQDEFNGELYVVTDDRNLKLKQDFLEAQKAFKNINLKKANILGFVEDGIQDYIFNQIAFPIDSDKEHFGKILFLLTMIMRVYFVRNADDTALITEDDVLWFKNPESLMEAGRSAVHHNIRHCSQVSDNPNQSTIEEVNEFNRDIVQNKEIDESLDYIEYYRAYTEKHPRSWLSQAHVICTYDEDFIPFLNRFVRSRYFKESVATCVKKGQKLYHAGFSIKLERLNSNYLNKQSPIDITDEVVVQSNSKSIDSPERIQKKDCYAYHYTIIPDEHIFKFLPTLLEFGVSAYKNAIKGWERTESDRKFQYLPDEVLEGWNQNKYLKREEKSAVRNFFDD